MQGETFFFEECHVHARHILVRNFAILQGIHQGLRSSDVDRLEDGQRLYAFGRIDAPVGQNLFHWPPSGGGEGWHAGEVRFKPCLFQGFHAKTVHPSGFGLKVGAFLEVHGHVERFTGEQIQAEAHVLALAKVATDVDRKRMNEIVDDAAEINQIAEAERERFNAFPFAKGREFETVGVHVGRQGQRDVGRERVKVHLAVQPQEGVFVGRFILKRDAEG